MGEFFRRFFLFFGVAVTPAEFPGEVSIGERVFKSAGWGPLATLLVLAVTISVGHSWWNFRALLDDCSEIVAWHDPEKARFSMSPWLRPFFETAERIQSQVPEDVPVLIFGRQRFFVAYRLSPRVCLDGGPKEPAGFETDVLDVVTVTSDGSVRFPQNSTNAEAGLLFRMDFETGTLGGQESGFVVGQRPQR